MQTKNGRFEYGSFCGPTFKMIKGTKKILGKGRGPHFGPQNSERTNLTQWPWEPKEEPVQSIFSFVHSYQPIVLLSIRVEHHKNGDVYYGLLMLKLITLENECRSFIFD